MTVVMIVYCKQIPSRMVISYIAKKQTSAKILKYMINQVLF